MKFLFFELKTVCYNSYFYFAESLAAQLEQKGHEIEFFRIDNEPFENIEKYVDQYFDAIIDFNSDLPRALLDDDSYYLDHINGPFYEVILDHPLYHHDSLRQTLKDFHVLCMDYNHKEYIKKNYPHIKTVDVLSMTGSTYVNGSSIDWNQWFERKFPIVFTGTNTNPNRLNAAFEGLPKNILNTTHEIISLMEKDYSLTIEDAVNSIMTEPLYDFIKDDYTYYVQAFYLADTYIRAKTRTNLIKTLDEYHIPVEIYGGLWNEANLKNIKPHNEINFNLSFKLFSQAKVVLNLMPNFKYGVHDRVYSSMLNGAVSLTDSSKLTDEQFTHKRDIIYYNPTKPEALCQQIMALLDSPEELIKIAQAGYENASKNHTWANRSDDLLKILV